MPPDSIRGWAMPNRHRITCIRKWPDHYDPHHRIQSIGGSTGSETGGPWQLDLDAAIDGILKGKWEFFVREAGAEVNVVIRQHGQRNYLRTVSDRLLQDNLLALPECLPTG